MRLSVLSTIVFLFPIIIFVQSCSSDVKSELRELDQVLLDRQSYDSTFERKITVAKNLLNGDNSTSVYIVYMILAKEYASHCLDSAILYCNKAEDLCTAPADDAKRINAKALLSQVFARGGYFTNSYLELVDIYDFFYSRKENLPVDLVFPFIYFDSSLKLIAEDKYALKDNFQLKPFGASNDYNVDSLIASLPKTSPSSYVLRIDKLKAEGRIQEAESLARTFFDVSLPGTFEYTLAANIYSSFIDGDEKIFWLAENAKANVRASVRDYSSLSKLSFMLFERGQVNRPLKYLARYSIRDAVDYGGNVRMREIAAYIPTLFDLYAMVNGRWVMWSLVLIAVLLIAVIFLMSLIRKSRSKINQLSDDPSQLTSDKNRLKEQKQGSQVVADHQLVTALFSICFQLLSEKRALLKNAIESLEKGHSEELLDRLSKDDRNNVDIKHYNLLMDSMFVKIYPDFVDKFCSLLKIGRAHV